MIQPSKDQAIHGTEGQSLRQMPSLDVKLMTKDQDLSLQRGPRPEPHDQHRPDHAASFSHKTETLRDSASLASRIRFPTGTDSRSCAGARTGWLTIRPASVKFRVDAEFDFANFIRPERPAGAGYAASQFQTRRNITLQLRRFSPRRFRYHPLAALLDKRARADKTSRTRPEACPFRGGCFSQNNAARSTF
jgi:hypothetical protein